MIAVNELNRFKLTRKKFNPRTFRSHMDSGQLFPENNPFDRIKRGIVAIAIFIGIFLAVHVTSLGSILQMEYDNAEVVNGELEDDGRSNPCGFGDDYDAEKCFDETKSNLISTTIFQIIFYLIPMFGLFEIYYGVSGLTRIENMLSRITRQQSGNEARMEGAEAGLLFPRYVSICQNLFSKLDPKLQENSLSSYNFRTAFESAKNRPHSLTREEIEYYVSEMNMCLSVLPVDLINEFTASPSFEIYRKVTEFYGQTKHVERPLPGLEQAVAHEAMEAEEATQPVASMNVPMTDTPAQRSDENGYEWFTTDDGTNFYRTVGSGAEWIKFEN